jgi:hypothetical protein
LSYEPTRQAPSCGATPPAAEFTPCFPWRRGWFMLGRTTATSTFSA